MPEASAPRSAFSWLEIIVPLLVGGAMLGVTFFLWKYTLQITTESAKINFQSRTDGLADAVQKRFNIFENILYDARGFYDSSDFVSRDEWKTYMTSIGIGNRNIGLTSLLVLKRVINDEKAEFIESTRAEAVSSTSAYLKSFTIFPDENKLEYFPVTYLEPQSSTSAQVMGFDHSSNAIRKTALDLARDTGKPQISGTTQSVTTGRNVFLMYIPLYATKSVPSDVVERRQNLLGYISAGFANDTIFSQIIADSNNTDAFTVRLYDGLVPDDQHLLYQQEVAYPENTTLQTHMQSFDVAGHTWTMVSQAPTDFGLGLNDKRSPNGTLVVGGIITILLTACAYLLMSSRKHALNIAQRISSDLKISDEKYRLMFESLQDVLYRTDLKGNITTISPSIEKYIGQTPEELKGHNALEFYSDIRQRAAMVQQLLMKGSVEDYQIQLKGKDGQVFEVSLNAHILLDENKKPIGVEGVLRDVTSRIKAEQLLRQQAQDLERSNQTMVDRELKMIELKKENEQLKAQLAAPTPHA